MTPQNLFASLPPASPEEVVSLLAQRGSVRVERVVSSGQASPPGFWYDQDEWEWVVLLQGQAEVSLEERRCVLKPGDWLEIPPRLRHRIEWTTPDEPTVWLAFFAVQPEANSLPT